MTEQMIDEANTIMEKMVRAIAKDLKLQFNQSGYYTYDFGKMLSLFKLHFGVYGSKYENDDLTMSIQFIDTEIPTQRGVWHNATVETVNAGGGIIYKLSQAIQKDLLIGEIKSVADRGNDYRYKFRYRISESGRIRVDKYLSKEIIGLTANIKNI